MGFSPWKPKSHYKVGKYKKKEDKENKQEQQVRKNLKIKSVY